MKHYTVPVVVFFICSFFCITFASMEFNITHSRDHEIKLSRSKRLAIYNGQGVVKFVVSIGHPIKLDMEKALFFFYNFQAQYVPTSIPIYYWSFWNTTAFVSTAREWRKDLQTTIRDDARMWVYDVIEIALERISGDMGATCLLRAICEISQMPFEKNHLLPELLNAVLIPTRNNVPEKYLDARDAGRAGADCARTHHECSSKLWRWLTHSTQTT